MLQAVLSSFMTKLQIVMGYL